MSNQHIRGIGGAKSFDIIDNVTTGNVTLGAGMTTGEITIGTQSSTGDVNIDSGGDVYLRGTNTISTGPIASQSYNPEDPGADLNLFVTQGNPTNLLTSATRAGDIQIGSPSAPGAINIDAGTGTLTLDGGTVSSAGTFKAQIIRANNPAGLMFIGDDSTATVTVGASSGGRDVTVDGGVSGNVSLITNGGTALVRAGATGNVTIANAQTTGTTAIATQPARTGAVNIGSATANFPLTLDAGTGAAVLDGGTTTVRSGGSVQLQPGNENVFCGTDGGANTRFRIYGSVAGQYSDLHQVGNVLRLNTVDSNLAIDTKSFFVRNSSSGVPNFNMENTNNSNRFYAEVRDTDVRLEYLGTNKWFFLSAADIDMRAPQTGNLDVHSTITSGKVRIANTSGFTGEVIIGDGAGSGDIFLDGGSGSVNVRAGTGSVSIGDNSNTGSVFVGSTSMTTGNVEIRSGASHTGDIVIGSSVKPSGTIFVDGGSSGVRLRCQTGLISVGDNNTTGNIEIGGTGLTTGNIEIRSGASHTGNIVIGSASKPSGQINIDAGSGTLNLDGSNYGDGTWTPVLGDGTNNFTLSLADGTYVRSGRQVQCWATISWTSPASTTGPLLVSGLPYTATKDSGFSINNISGASFSSNLPMSGRVIATTTNLFLYACDNSTGALAQLNQSNAALDLGGSGTMYIQFSYFV